MTFINELNEFKTVFDKKLNDFFSSTSAVNNTLKKYYELIQQFTSHGKRLRPFVLSLAYKECGGRDNIMLTAISVELHHAYSKILDDIMDEDDLRYGKPTIHKHLRDQIQDNKTQSGTLFNSRASRHAASFAMMLGNITNLYSQEAVLKSNFSDELKNKVLSELNKMDQLLYQGQMLDLLMEKKDILSEEEYLYMVRLKTAELFGSCFKIGCILAKIDENIQNKYYEFGVNTAIAFQIQDDILDITPGKGHELGSDIKKGKRTLLINKTLSKLNDKNKNLILQILGKSIATEAEINHVIKLMHETNSIIESKKLAEHYLKKANSILKPKNPNFSEYANFMTTRNY